MQAAIRWVRYLLIVTTMVTVIPPILAEDTPIDLDDYKGKVVVVDFWASWCAPCRRSFPWLDEMQSKYRDQGLVVIAVNMDAERQEADAFLQEFPVSFRIVYDADGSLARGYEVVAMPSSYVIGRNGNIVAHHLGFKTARLSEYEAVLQAALNNIESMTEAPVR